MGEVVEVEVDENGLRLTPTPSRSDSSKRSIDTLAFQALSHLRAACLAVRGVGLHSSGVLAMNLYDEVEKELRSEALERFSVDLTNLPGRPAR